MVLRPLKELPEYLWEKVYVILRCKIGISSYPDLEFEPTHMYIALPVYDKWLNGIHRC